MITTPVRDTTPIHAASLMLKSARPTSDTLSGKKKKNLKVGTLAAEITLLQKLNKKLPCGIRLNLKNICERFPSYFLNHPCPVWHILEFQFQHFQEFGKPFFCLEYQIELQGC